MKLNRCCRVLAWLGCGALMLQTTGCTIEAILPTLIYYGISALLTSLLGLPTY